MYVLRLRFRQNGYGFDAAVEGLQLFLPPEKKGAKVKEIVSRCRLSFHARRQNAASSRLASLSQPLMMSGRTFSGFSRQNIAASSKNQLTTSKTSH